MKLILDVHRDELVDFDLEVKDEERYYEHREQREKLSSKDAELNQAVQQSIKSLEHLKEKEEALLHFFTKIGCFKDLPKMSKKEAEKRVLSMTLGKKF